jgi:hypothetical protein
MYWVVPGLNLTWGFRGFPQWFHLNAGIVLQTGTGPIRFIPFPQLSQYSDSLRAARSGVRTPEKASLSTLVQTGCDPSPPPTTSFIEIKRPDHGVEHPLLSSAEVKEKPYLYSRSVPSRHVTGSTSLYLHSFQFTVHQSKYHSTLQSELLKASCNKF